MKILRQLKVFIFKISFRSLSTIIAQKISGVTDLLLFKTSFRPKGTKVQLVKVLIIIIIFTHPGTFGKPCIGKFGEL